MERSSEGFRSPRAFFRAALGFAQNLRKFFSILVWISLIIISLVLASFSFKRIFCAFLKDFREGGFLDILCSISVAIKESFWCGLLFLILWIAFFIDFIAIVYFCTMRFGRVG